MDTTDYIKIAESIADINFGSNNMAEVTIGDKTICIANINNELKACAAKCPHASGIMANGFIDALGNIVCPLHRYKFSMLNGRNVSGEGYYLKTYQIVITENGIFIKKEKSTSIFNLFK